MENSSTRAGDQHKPEDEGEVLLRQALMSLAKRPTPQRVDLPKFSGKENENIMRHIRKMHQLAKFNGWTEDELNDALPLTLEGRASTFYNTLSTSKKNQLKMVEESLKEEFFSPEKQWQTRSKLYVLRQNDDSLDEFIEKLEKLSQLVNVDDCTKMDIFVQ